MDRHTAEHRMKNIVMCCDGTGNEYGTNNTNVVTTYELAEDGAGQCRYYDPGDRDRWLGIRRERWHRARRHGSGDRPTGCARTSRMPTGS